MIRENKDKILKEISEELEIGLSTVYQILNGYDKFQPQLKNKTVFAMTTNHDSLELAQKSMDGEHHHIKNYLKILEKQHLMQQ